ncbi:MAG: hypothetical protein MZV63_59635 [Marinilabiliales bacterium]|nr:hypothetical protein [Marinilabiliales bacterium]
MLITTSIITEMGSRRIPISMWQVVCKCKPCAVGGNNLLIDSVDQTCRPEIPVRLWHMTGE